MMRRWMLALTCMLACSTMGCALCDRSQDDTYSAFGGRWPRADRRGGRVGSLFDPAEAAVIPSGSPVEGGDVESGDMEGGDLGSGNELGDWLNEGESVLRQPPREQQAPAAGSVPSGESAPPPPSGASGSGLQFDPIPPDDTGSAADSSEAPPAFSLPPDTPPTPGDAPSTTTEGSRYGAPEAAPKAVLPEATQPKAGDDSRSLVPNDLRGVPAESSDAEKAVGGLSDAPPAAGAAPDQGGLPPFDSVLPKPE